MSDRELTTEELKWLKKFQKLMDACPSSTLGAYITGDPTMTIYDRPLFEAYQDDHGYDRNAKDDVTIHQDIGSVLYYIDMPFGIDGVCG